MTNEGIAIGLTITGLVFAFFGLGLGIWVSDGDWRRAKQGKTVLWLEIIAALLFIAAVWVGVSG